MLLIETIRSSLLMTSRWLMQVGICIKWALFEETCIACVIRILLTLPLDTTKMFFFSSLRMVLKSFAISSIFVLFL